MSETEIDYSNEIWKKTPGYANYYEVSSMGRIRNSERNHILKLQDSGHGYLNVYIRNENGKVVNVGVHRVVAQAFIPNPNPDRLTSVDHIDRVRDNNRVENLRWACSKMQRENVDESKLYRLRRRVRAINLDGSIHKEYDSLKEAAQDVKGYGVLIGKVCSGERRTHAGYRWEYLDSDELDDDILPGLKPGVSRLTGT